MDEAIRYLLGVPGLPRLADQGALRIDRDPAMTAFSVPRTNTVLMELEPGCGFCLDAFSSREPASASLNRYVDLNFSKYGTRRPANGTKRAATSSPIARSCAPCAIMRNPSTASMRTML